jgi:hypothetical protein
MTYGKEQIHQHWCYDPNTDQRAVCEPTVKPRGLASTLAYHLQSLSREIMAQNVATYSDQKLVVGLSVAAVL